MITLKYICTTIFCLLAIKINAQNIGINTTNPKYQLSFNNGLGDKISLWSDPMISSATPDHYGFGVQSGKLQIFTPTLSDDVVFGTGRSATFTERMRITGDGLVGIGINNPSLPLSFAATLGKKISLYHGTTGDAGFGVFGNELRINTDYNGADITFGYDNYTNGFTEKMRLTAGGNLGIGINNPSASLYVTRGSGVNGTAAFSGTTHTSHFNYDVNEHTFIRGGKANSHVIINDLTGLGNVGIGTNNPLEKLHIIGGIRASTLAGTGTRPLYATLSGQITTAAPALTYFYSIPSVAFSQDFNDDSWVNSAVQTYFNDASTHAIYAPVNLPDGATITYIAIKYLDNSSNELSCSLLTNNLNGSLPTETVVGNTINALQGTIFVNNLSININNLTKSYLLRITGPWDGGNMRIFGAVIGYTN